MREEITSRHHPQCLRPDTHRVGNGGQRRRQPSLCITSQRLDGSSPLRRIRSLNSTALVLCLLMLLLDPAISQTSQPPSVPPSGVTLVTTDGTSATLNWTTLPAIHNVTHYVVDGVGIGNPYNVTDASVTLIGLQHLTAYHVNVTAHNVAGAGPPAMFSFNTTEDVPMAPRLSVAANQTTVTLRIHAARGGYLASSFFFSIMLSEISKVSQQSQTAMEISRGPCGSSNCSHTFTNLEEDSIFVISGSVANGQQDRSPTAINIATTLKAAPSAAPQNLRADSSAVTQTSITVVWDDIALKERNDQITGYDVFLNDSTVMTSSASSSRSATFAGLKSETVYSFTVRGNNGVGAGVLSAPVVTATAAYPYPRLLLNSSSEGLNSTYADPVITLQAPVVNLLPATVSLDSPLAGPVLTLSATLWSPPDLDREGLVSTSANATPSSDVRSPFDQSHTLTFAASTDAEYTDILRGLRYRHTLLGPSSSATRRVTVVALDASGRVSNTITTTLAWNLTVPLPRVAFSATAEFGTSTNVSFQEGSASGAYVSQVTRLEYPLPNTFTKVEVTLSAALANGSRYDTTDDGDRILPVFMGFPVVNIVGSANSLTFTPRSGTVSLREWRDEVFSRIVYTNLDAEPKYRANILEDGGADTIIHRWVTYTVTTAAHSQPISVGATNVSLVTINDNAPVLCSTCPQSDAPCGSGSRRRRRSVDASLVLSFGSMEEERSFAAEFKRDRPLQPVPTVKSVSFGHFSDLHRGEQWIRVEFSGNTNRPQLHPLSESPIRLHPEHLNTAALIPIWRDERNLILIPDTKGRKSSPPHHDKTDTVSVEFRPVSDDGDAAEKCRRTVCHEDGWSDGLVGKWSSTQRTHSDDERHVETMPLRRVIGTGLILLALYCFTNFLLLPSLRRSAKRRHVSGVPWKSHQAAKRRNSWRLDSKHPRHGKDGLRAHRGGLCVVGDGESAVKTLSSAAVDVGAQHDIAVAKRTGSIEELRVSGDSV